MGVLCNLCVLGTNGAAFIESGCLTLWTKIYDDAVNQYPIRLGCATMISNLASQPESCVLLAVNDEGIKFDVLTLLSMVSMIK